MNFDNFFDEKTQEKLFQEQQQKLQEKKIEFEPKKEDLSVFFPNLGLKKESNVVTGRFFPTSPEFDKSTEFGRVNLAIKKMHKFSEGTQDLKEICLKSLEYYFLRTEDIPKKYPFKIYKDYKTGEEKIVFQCPCCEANKFPGKKLKECITEEDKSKYNEWHRKKAEKTPKGWVNFYIESDLLYPENNGRVVKLYINGLLYPIIENFFKGKIINGQVVEEGKNIFSVSGTCYRFKIFVEKGGDGYITYKNSKFEECEALPKDKTIELIKQTHDIASTLKIKSYDELKKKLDDFYNAEIDDEAYKKLDDEVPDFYKPKKTVSSLNDEELEEKTNNFNSELSKKVMENDNNNEDEELPKYKEDKKENTLISDKELDKFFDLEG